MSETSDPIRVWLTQAVCDNASDLHLVCGHPPVLRVHGELQRLDEPMLTDDILRPILKTICPDGLYRQFEQTRDVDFSLEFEIEGQPHRFRVNGFVADQCVGICVRLVPTRIPKLEWAGFPRDIAERLIRYRNGLILLTGITGSGKTTTLAMLVDLLNSRGNQRIITIEEPVEYRYPLREGSVVTQREVGLDVDSFAAGLKHGLRQDPDVILVGEIRDTETARMALSAAETGHLVLATLHTRDVKGAISRYADIFPQSAQNEVRSQLALCLRAIISQHLIPSVEVGTKRKLALEIMFKTPPIENAIRMNKLPSIDNYILTGRSQGMVTLDDSVKLLLQEGHIAREVAERFVSNPSALM